MSNNSPTCILSTTCLKGPTNTGLRPQVVSTISSEVESSSRDNSSAPCTRCVYLDQTNPECKHHETHCRVSSPVNTIICPPGEQNGGISIQANVTNVAQNVPVPKSSKSSKISGWKTSKFFSKTMSSGDILRGLKKLSLTSGGEDGENKPSLKSKLSNLKKRSSCGNEEVTVDVEALAAAAAAKIEQKAGRPPSLSESAALQKSSQDEGIVCKKEDLKAIILGASRRISTSSTSPRRAPLRQTKSASFEPAKDEVKKGVVRRTGSEESRPKKTLIVEAELQPAVSKASIESEVFEEQKLLVEVPFEAKMIPPAQQLRLPTPPVSNVGSSDDNVSTVKWDECEVVDAVLIGDAIETFLKGSMSGGEKRVSFRKSLN